MAEQGDDPDVDFSDLPEIKVSPKLQLLPTMSEMGRIAADDPLVDLDAGVTGGTTDDDVVDGPVVDLSAAGEHVVDGSPGAIAGDAAGEHVVDGSHGAIAGDAAVEDVVDGSHAAIAGDAAVEHVVDGSHTAIAGDAAGEHVVDGSHTAIAGAAAGEHVVDGSHTAIAGDAPGEHVVDGSHAAIAGEHVVDGLHAAIAGDGSHAAIAGDAAGAAKKELDKKTKPCAVEIVRLLLKEQKVNSESTMDRKELNKRLPAYKSSMDKILPMLTDKELITEADYCAYLVKRKLIAPRKGFTYWVVQVEGTDQQVWEQMKEDVRKHTRDILEAAAQYQRDALAKFQDYLQKKENSVMASLFTAEESQSALEQLKHNFAGNSEHLKSLAQELQQSAFVEFDNYLKSSM